MDGADKCRSNYSKERREQDRLITTLCCPFKIATKADITAKTNMGGIKGHMRHPVQQTRTTKLQNNPSKFLPQLFCSICIFLNSFKIAI